MVRTVDADGNAPKRRIGSVSAAWGSYSRIKDANRRRDARFGDIAGIFAGFPPTPPVTLERNGQADMPNINTKEFEAKVKTYAATWMSLNSQGDGYADITAEHPDPMEKERRSKVLTKEFNEAIKMWEASSMDDYVCGSQYLMESSARDIQMALFGIGVTFFCDPIDFRFRMIPTRRVLVPDGTRLTLNNCPAIFIEDVMSVTDLYGMRDKKGWNKDVILRNLYDHVEQTMNSSGRRVTYAEWIQRIRENDEWLQSELLPVPIIHCFTKEFDGTITQSTFTELYGDGKTNQQDENDKPANGFLFDMPKVAKSWRQVIVPFADNAGTECDWHGVKGFGDMIFDGCHLNNLMFNRAASAATMQNMLMFKGTSEADADKLDQITFTQFGLMAPGLEFEQVRFFADPQSAIGVLSMGKQIISENTRISPQNEKTVTSEQPTATQVNADRADRAQLSTLQISVYRANGLDVQFGEMYRRIAQPGSKYPEKWGGGIVAKRFRERCEQQGIPEGDLLKISYVRANRNSGSGDLMLDVMKADQLMSVATPGRGQANARKEKIAALKGVEMVPAFFEDEPHIPGQQDAMLSMENNLITLGQSPTAYGYQDQEAHAVSHLQLLSEAAKVASQLDEAGIAPEQVEGARNLHRMLTAGVAHMGQHIALMQSVPRAGKQPALYEQLLAEVTKQVHNLAQIADSLGEAVAKAQPPQPAQSPEMLKAQQDMQIRGAMAQQDMDLKAQSHMAKLGNLAVQQQARGQMKIENAQMDEALRASKTESELAQKELNAHQDRNIAAANAVHEMAIKKKESEQAEPAQT